MEIRGSYDRLISTMGFSILVRRHIYIESGPRSQHTAVFDDPSAGTVLTTHETCFPEPFSGYQWFQIMLLRSHDILQNVCSDLRSSFYFCRVNMNLRWAHSWCQHHMKTTELHFSIKITSKQYRKSNCGDQIILYPLWDRSILIRDFLCVEW